MTLHDILGLVLAAPFVIIIGCLIYSIYRDWHRPGVKEGVAVGLTLVVWSLLAIAWVMTQ